MIERTYREYRDLLSRLSLTVNAALEVGAHADSTSILAANELAAVPNKVGVNLNGGGRFRGVPVLRMDARQLAFADHTFDLVVCASTLEHIPDFWRACAEMKRVLVPGGTMIVSVPGYADSVSGNYLRALGFTLRLPDWWKRGTLTMGIHEAPHDYYRFSEYALKASVLDGLTDVRTWRIMTPPRLYGLGRKPGVPA